MDYRCECGNEVGGYDENYVVMCHKCGKNMKPLIAKPDPSAKLACSDGLCAELKNLARIVKDYVGATECTCPEPYENGLKEFECWHCVFKYNLACLDNEKENT